MQANIGRHSRTSPKKEELLRSQQRSSRIERDKQEELNRPRKSMLWRRRTSFSKLRNSGNQLRRRLSKDQRQCDIPKLAGKDLRRTAKGLLSMRSVAMCGWRSQEIKALSEEMFCNPLQANREKPAMARDFASEQWEKINVWELSLWTGPSSSTALKEAWTTVWFRW